MELRFTQVISKPISDSPIETWPGALPISSTREPRGRSRAMARYCS